MNELIAYYPANKRKLTFFYCELCPSLRMSNFDGLINHYNSSLHRGEDYNIKIEDPESRKRLGLNPLVKIEQKINRKCEVCMEELEMANDNQSYIEHLIEYHNYRSYDFVLDPYIKKCIDLNDYKLNKDCEFCEEELGYDVNDFIKHYKSVHKGLINVSIDSVIKDKYITSVLLGKSTYIPTSYNSLQNCEICFEQLINNNDNPSSFKQKIQKHKDEHKKGDRYLSEYFKSKKNSMGPVIKDIPKPIVQQNSKQLVDNLKKLNINKIGNVNNNHGMSVNNQENIDDNISIITSSQSDFLSIIDDFPNNQNNPQFKINFKILYFNLLNYLKYLK